MYSGLMKICWVMISKVSAFFIDCLRYGYSKKWEAISSKVIQQTEMFKPVCRVEFYGTDSNGDKMCTFTDELLDICVDCAQEILPQLKSELKDNPKKFFTNNEYVLELTYNIEEIEDIEIQIVEDEYGDFNHCSSCGILLKDTWVLDYPNDAIDEYLDIPGNFSEPVTKTGWYCLGVIIDFCVTHLDRIDKRRLRRLFKRIEFET